MYYPKIYIITRKISGVLYLRKKITIVKERNKAYFINILLYEICFNIFQSLPNKLCEIHIKTLNEFSCTRKKILSYIWYLHFFPLFIISVNIMNNSFILSCPDILLDLIYINSDLSMTIYKHSHYWNKYAFSVIYPSIWLTDN